MEEAVEVLNMYAPLLAILAAVVLVAAYLSARTTVRHLRSKEQELQRRLEDTAFAKVGARPASMRRLLIEAWVKAERDHSTWQAACRAQPSC